MVRSLVRLALAAIVLPAAPLAAQVLQVERDVSVGGMVSDRFTWRDASNQERVAVLAHSTGYSAVSP